MAHRRILLASDLFAPHAGGNEAFVEELGVQLLAQGYSIDVLTRSLKERERIVHRGMTIYDVEVDGSALTGTIRGEVTRARSILADGAYDAAFLFGDPLGWNLWIASPPKIRGSKIILVPSINSEGLRAWGASLPARKQVAGLLRFADAVVSLSQNGADARFYKEESIANVYIPNSAAPGTNGWDAIVSRYLALFERQPLPAANASVAVITRTKHRPSLLRRGIESVLAQRYTNWLHVIVNDGGDRKAVEEAVAPFLDRYAGRLKLLHNDSSVGMEAASNLGIRGSDSDFIAMHDDDDSWHPDFLLETVAFLQAPHPPATYGAVACWTMTVREELLPDGQLKLLKQEDWNSWLNDVSLFQMSARNTLSNNSILFKRDLYNELGGFSERLPVLGDWDFNLRLLQRTNIGLLHQRLAYYHQRMNVASGEMGNTVVAGVNQHVEIDVFLRNELLRRDLASGEFGMGALANIARQLDEMSKSIKALDELRQRQLNFEKQVASLEANLRTIAQATQLMMKKP